MYTPNTKDVVVPTQELRSEFAKLYFLLTKMEEYGNTEGLDYLYIKSRYYRLITLEILGK